jgi:hypothetical protein
MYKDLVDGGLPAAVEPAGGPCRRPFSCRRVCPFLVQVGPCEALRTPGGQAQAQPSSGVISNACCNILYRYRYRGDRSARTAKRF